MWWIIGIMAVFILTAALVVWRWVMGPLYSPGDVRRGKHTPESLVPDAPDENPWRVAPGIALHHFEEGAGPKILVLHGGPGHAFKKPWLAGKLLANKYQLIYYHQRGCGLSTRPIQALPGKFYSQLVELHRKLGLPAQIGDIERIRHILREDRLILMGHSFGAFLAALYAAEFPDHVRSLVFVAPANIMVLPGKAENNLFDAVGRRLPQEIKPEYNRYLAQYFDFRRAFRMTETELSRFYARFAQFYAAAVPYKCAEVSDAAGTGFMPLAVFASMGKYHNYTSALKAIHCPVLVIHGTEDLQPESSSRGFAGYFENNRFASIEGAGHFPFEDCPERFAVVVQEFLEKPMGAE